ncbi:MAG TPA: CdaR family protein [Geobacteraceae bacterium]|nr:CdaR family protein [Geobacteraceae bacterium]
MKILETVTHNLWLKALSLFLAAVLWVFVAAGREAETGFSLPVIYGNIPPGLAMVNRPPVRIDVRLAGPRIMLYRLDAERFPVCLDLKGAVAGRTVFPEVESKIRIPYGLRVTRVTPAAIEVILAGSDNPTSR